MTTTSSTNSSTKNNTRRLLNAVNTVDNSEGMQNKNSYFVSDEHNYDAQQSLTMMKCKQDMINNVEVNKINSQDMPSVNDAKDYLGCVGDQCSKIDDISNHGKKMDIKSRSQQELIFNNVKPSLGKKTNSNNSNKKKDSVHSILRRNLDAMISFVYIFLITILLLATVLHKQNNYLIHIIILTLLYVFYKIYLAYKK